MLKKKKNYLVFDLGGVVCHDVPYKFANVLFPPAFFKFLHQRESGKEVFEKFSTMAQSHMKKFRTNCVFACEGDFWKKVFLETDTVVTSIPFIDTFFQYLGPEYNNPNKNSSVESKEEKLNMIVSYMKKMIRRNYGVFVETMALLHVLRKNIQKKSLKKEQERLRNRVSLEESIAEVLEDSQEASFHEEEHETADTNNNNGTEIQTTMNIINNLPSTETTEQQSASSISYSVALTGNGTSSASPALHPSPKLSPSSPSCGASIPASSAVTTPSASPVTIGLTLPKQNKSAPASPLQKEKIPFQCPYFESDAESKSKFRALKKSFKQKYAPLFEQLDFEEVGILSNHTKYWFYEMFDFFGLNKFFSQKDLVVVSCDVGVAKPSDDVFRILKNRIFSHMLKEAESLPTEDDTEENVRSAARNGFIGIKYNALKENIGSLMEKLLVNMQKHSGSTCITTITSTTITSTTTTTATTSTTTTSTTTEHLEIDIVAKK